MLIRQDFQSLETLPPKPFLMQVMDPLTKEYCFLWDKKDSENRISMSWKDVSIFFNKNTFRSGLRKLNNQGLLSYQEDLEGITIELIGWEDISEEE